MFFLGLRQTLLAGIFIFICTLAKGEQIPVEYWVVSELRGSSGTATLPMPSSIDEEGTVTLELTSDMEPRISRFYKKDFPAQLQFLFAESDSLYVYTPSSSIKMEFVEDHNLAAEDVTTSEAIQNISFFGVTVSSNTVSTSSSIRDYKQVYKSQISIPYNKKNHQPASRRVKFADAVGNPLVGFHAELTLDSRVKNYNLFAGQIPMDADATVTLPPLVDPQYSPGSRWSRLAAMYEVTVVQNSNGQRHRANLLPFISMPMVTVHIPIANSGHAELDYAEARITRGKSSSAAGTVLTIPIKDSASSPEEVMKIYDSQDIYARQILVGDDGNLQLAFPRPNKFTESADTSVTLKVSPEYTHVFDEPDINLQFNLEASQTIELPSRISVTAQLIKSDGTPVELEEQSYTTEWGGVNVSLTGSDCRLRESDNLSFRNGRTTGTLLELVQMKVPGTYVIQNQDIRYGPVQLDETSPTEIVRFPQAPPPGHYLGAVTDEAGAPIAGAVVVSVKSRQAMDDIALMSDFLIGISDRSSEEIRKELEVLTSQTLAVSVTSSEGRFDLPGRRQRPRYQVPYIMVFAKGRMPAFISDETSECDMPITENLEFPSIKLPHSTVAAGVLKTAANHESFIQMMPPEYRSDSYLAYLYNQHKWISQESVRGMKWSYYTKSQTVRFNEPFVTTVPVGIKFELAAAPTGIGYNAAVWSGQIARKDEKLNLEPKWPGYLKPFYIEVQYADGSPASEIEIVSRNVKPAIRENERFSVYPYTGSDGRVLFYTWGDSSTTLTLSDRRDRSKTQIIPPFTLDKTSSLPEAVIKLDPGIWGQSNR